ncbi:FERM domain-containing protein 5 [Hypsibius exemplaris]|uniref:FERM domain-containing protein 5 n=1 Tax=Hypsibius exemplaris TaxID=2072580 RepID=A0A9X6RK17_HYPEX|nr:FERM domain-containing protein 5 [Hypsibius exemplaris]
MHLFGHDLNKTYRCTVRYLDDTSWETTYSKHEDSQKMFDRICNHINLIEKDYFGLRFIDESKQRKWLDLGKNARKQLKKAGRDENVIVSFRVKFYPPDPMTRLNEELTRYQLFLQLRRDLQHGRLYGSSGEEALLSACILQSEVGDMPPGTTAVPPDYLSLNKHGKKGETKTLDQWSVLRGTSSQECESRFLSHASDFATFGIDPHPVRNEANEQVFLGYNHAGIIAYQGSRKIVHLDWAHIIKMSYEKKTFLMYYVRDSKKQTKGFKCPTPKAAKHLWRNALETKIFFTAPTSKNVATITNEGTSLFSRASRLRFSGRVAREAFDNGQAQKRPDVVFQRVAFGQAKLLGAGDAEVYEGVLATPGLHRRPSIYPVGKERDLSVARSVVSSNAAPSSPDSPPTSPEPTDTQPRTATVAEPPEAVQKPPTPRALPPVYSEAVLPAEKLLHSKTKSRIDEVLNGGRNGSLLMSEAVQVPETPTVETLSMVGHPRTSTLGMIAMAGLVAGTGLLGVYTLFETNWLPSNVADLLAPLRMGLYAPMRNLFTRLFFASAAASDVLSPSVSNDTVPVDFVI